MPLQWFCLNMLPINNSYLLNCICYLWSVYIYIYIYVSLYICWYLACKEGYFGTNCSRVCSPNCKLDTCRHTDGSCTSCTAGWRGYNCTTGNTFIGCSMFYKFVLTVLLSNSMKKKTFLLLCDWIVKRYSSNYYDNVNHLLLSFLIC